MSEVTLTQSTLEVADDMGDRECLEFLDASPESHPLLGMGVLIMKVIKVLYTQQWWEHPEGATDQHV